MRNNQLTTQYKGITIIHLLDGHGYIVKDIEKKERRNSFGNYEFIRLYGDAFREYHRYSEVNHRFSKIYPTLKQIKLDIDFYRIRHPELKLAYLN